MSDEKLGSQGGVQGILTGLAVQGESRGQDEGR